MILLCVCIVKSPNKNYLTKFKMYLSPDVHSFTFLSLSRNAHVHTVPDDEQKWSADREYETFSMLYTACTTFSTPSQVTFRQDENTQTSVRIFKM